MHNTISLQLRKKKKRKEKFKSYRFPIIILVEKCQFYPCEFFFFLFSASLQTTHFSGDIKKKKNSFLKGNRLPFTPRRRRGSEGRAATRRAPEPGRPAPSGTRRR